MRRVGFAIVLLLAAVLALGGVVQAAENTASGEVDFAITVKASGGAESAGMQTSMSGHVWFSGNKARTETSVSLPAGAEGKPKEVPSGEMKMVSIVDGDAKVAYMLVPEMKVAMKVSLDDPQLQERGSRNPRSLLDPESYPGDAKVTELGVRTYKGMKVTAYRVTWKVEKESGESTVYVNAQKLPVYAKSVVMGTTMEMTYSNYKLHKVDASLFRVPEGYRIMDMASMANMARGMGMPRGN